MVIVKKDGRFEEFNSTKLIKNIGAKYKATEAVNIFNQIENVVN